MSPAASAPAMSYFYPRPLRGGRPFGIAVYLVSQQFLSTPSARRATGCSTTTTPSQTYFYPRPLRGGRPEVCGADRRICEISIHALCEEGDVPSPTPATKTKYFYPRPLRGGRQGMFHSSCVERLFLSTPSARRATAKTETKSLFSNKLYNILHEFRRALIYNGSKSYPNHAK